MSVQSQIDRIRQNIANTYVVASALGVETPTESTSNNLAETVGAVFEKGYEDGKKEGKPSGVSMKDVNFLDYDGTVLYAYTVAEAQALTELPALPSHEGLVCQGWNYDLATIKSYNRAVNVGALYITDDGKTRLYIRIAAKGRMTVQLCFSQTVANGVTIDWGDGSATQTLSGTGNVNTTHTYASIGNYVITLGVTSGCTLRLGHNNNSYCVMGSPGESRRVYCNMLQKVEIGERVTSIGYYSFYYYYSLASITIPNSVTSINSNAFNYCSSLVNVNIPNGVTSIGSNTFNNCNSLASITIPNSVTSIGDYAFNGCCSLASITIPDGVTSISSRAFNACYSLVNVTIPNGVTTIDSATFQNCWGMAIYDFTSHTSVPTLANADAFNRIPSDCEIRVPSALYDEWIAETNWSTYASQIVAIVAFTIDGTSYQAEEDMTWGEWVESKYNTLEIMIHSDGQQVVDKNGEYYVGISGGKPVGSGFKIQSNQNYVMWLY